MYYYLSFATPDVFLGATIVRADSHKGALQEAKDCELYPGGEAMVFELPSGFDEKAPIHVIYLYRLVVLEEMMAKEDVVKIAELPPEDRAWVEGLGVVLGGEDKV